MRDRYLKVFQLSKTPIQIWRKTDRHVIDINGRWGYKWLHRLVWRMAMNLGMIRHHVAVEETTKVSAIDTYDRDIGKLIFEHIQQFLYDGHNPSQLTVVIGEHHYRKYQMDLMKTYSYTHNIDMSHKGTTRLWGVPVIINPFMEGVIVIPHKLMKENS